VVALGFDVDALAGAEKVRAFLSYSRKDIVFVKRLETALDSYGLETLVDLSDIEAFEDWWIRTETLIRKADAFIFVISPDSIQSAVCLKELQLAVSLNKRLAPLVLKDVAPSDVPEYLRKLNFIDFKEDERFDAEAAKIVAALDTDIAWVRRHTDLGEQAYRWSEAKPNRRNGLLLRSALLEEAEAWVASRPRGAPAPTDLTRRFIAESRRVGSLRRNFAIAALIFGLAVTTSLAGLFYWQRGIADTQAARANEQTENTRATVSKLLSEQATRLNGEGDALKAALTSLEAFRDPGGGTDRYEADAEKSLGDAIYGLPLRASLNDAQSAIIDATFSFDGRKILAVHENGSVSLWRQINEQLVPDSERTESLKQFSGIKNVTSFPKTSVFVLQAEDGSYSAWDYASDERLKRINGKCQKDTVQFDFDASGTKLFAFCGDSLRISDIEKGSIVTLGPLSNYSMAGNGTSFIIYRSKRAELWDAGSVKQIRSWKSERPIDVWLNFEGDKILETRTGPEMKDKGSQTGLYRVKIISSQTGKTIVGNLPTQGRTFGVNTTGASQIFATSGDEGVNVWNNQETPAVIQHLDGGLDFLSNGILLVEGDTKITAWQYFLDTRLGHYISSKRATLQWRESHSFLDANFDNSEILTLSDAGDLLLWSLKPPMLLRANDEAPECLASVTIAKGANLMATLGSFEPYHRRGRCGHFERGDAVIFWDLNTLQVQKRMDLRGLGRLTSLSTDALGQRILVTFFRQPKLNDVHDIPLFQEYKVIDVATNEILLPKENQRGQKIYASAMSEDGSTVALSEGSKIDIWKLHGDGESRTCQLDSSIVVGIIAYNNTSNNIALADTSGNLWTLVPATCNLTKVPVAVGQHAIAVDLKYRGTLVAAELPVKDPDTDASSNVLVLWDEASDRILLNQKLTPTSELTPLELFSDSLRLAQSGGPNGEKNVFVIDIGSQRKLLDFDIDFNGCCNIVAIKLLNDDHELLTVWSERDVTRMRVWRIFSTVEELKNYAKRNIPECLSPEARQVQGLGSEPPRWCIELSKKPYESSSWKEWLRKRDSGDNAPMPD
jgi:hypothetical protein